MKKGHLNLLDSLSHPRRPRWSGFSRQPVDQKISSVKGTAKADPPTPAIQVGESASAVSITIAPMSLPDMNIIDVPPVDDAR